MTALMGPSGAGKTTLLDVLAGRTDDACIEGAVLYNGMPRDKYLRNALAYVEQQDVLIPTLTVRELLTYSAKMKFPASFTKFDINRRVRFIHFSFSRTAAERNRFMT